MRDYQFTLTGISPLIMHWDNIDWADKLKKWRTKSENKKISVAGDDRSPAFTWLGSVYNDGSTVALPQDNLQRCMMEGGAMVPVPGGRSGKTFKAQTQSGMVIVESHMPVEINGQTIPISALSDLEGVSDFEVHKATAVALGFSLFTKRAKIGTSKHIRVRPRFDRWKLTGTLRVWDDQLTKDTLTEILSVAGNFKGLGDWRPSSRTPGPFGRFTSVLQ